MVQLKHVRAHRSLERQEMERALGQINISMPRKSAVRRRHYFADSESEGGARIILREIGRQFGYRPKYESRLPWARPFITSKR